MQAAAAAAACLLLALLGLATAWTQLGPTMGLHAQVGAHAWHAPPRRPTHPPCPSMQARHLTPRPPQLAASQARLAAWWPVGGGAAAADPKAAGAAAVDALNAAIEARIPRYWQEIQRICPNMTYRACQEFPREQRTSLAHSQVGGRLHVCGAAR